MSAKTANWPTVDAHSATLGVSGNYLRQLIRRGSVPKTFIARGPRKLPSTEVRQVLLINPRYSIATAEPTDGWISLKDAESKSAEVLGEAIPYGTWKAICDSAKFPILGRKVAQKYLRVERRTKWKKRIAQGLHMSEADYKVIVAARKDRRDRVTMPDGDYMSPEALEREEGQLPYLRAGKDGTRNVNKAIAKLRDHVSTHLGRKIRAIDDWYFHHHRIKGKEVWRLRYGALYHVADYRTVLASATTATPFDPMRDRVDTVKSLLAALVAGKNITEAAHLAGKDKATIYMWRKKSQTFARALDNPRVVLRHMESANRPMGGDGADGADAPVPDHLTAEARAQTQTAPLPEKPLSGRQHGILDALLAMKAFSVTMRVTLTEVSERLDDKPDAPTLSRAAAKLKSLSLVESAKGRDGGLWLTESGKDKAEQFRRR